MNDASFYQGLLHRQGFAILEWLGDGAFRFLGEPPSFCKDLMGDAVDLTAAIRFDDRFPFLEGFVHEAQTVWDSLSRSSMDSGLWVERTTSGRDLGLEATAICLLGRRILLIQNAQDRHARQVRVMQVARNASLEHERLQMELQKKEILLHCIVHDLSQPLTSMRAALSLMALQDLPPRFKLAVESAKRESIRQEEMIHAILTAFSADLAAQRLEQDPKRAPDLAACARKTVEAFHDAFLERAARIELDPALDLARPWRVHGEESHILRIYGNLVENALRLSSPNSVVTVGVDDDHQFLRGFVKDQGPGLSHGQSQQIFSLFAKGKCGGKVGLGLYFCKITVEKWGGSIGCESRPTGGAHFWFRLPRT